MAAVRKPLNAVIFAFPLIFLFFQMRHTSEGKRVWDYATRGWDASTQVLHLPNRALAAASVGNFCHTEDGLDVRTFSDMTVSKHNCFGSCRHKNPLMSTFLDHAVEAPHMSALCLLNPFHGFYDCVWPLVHYLTTCVSLQKLSVPPIILTNNAELSYLRRRKWVVRAQEMYLKAPNAHGRLVEVPGSQCICFRSVVKFKRKTFWRPVRFQYKQEFGNGTVYASHPAGTKRNGLVTFREAVLQSLNLDSKPPSNALPVLVYGREDTTRRIWRNAASFVTLLAKELPSDVPILHITKIPSSFEEQVINFNQAALLIAPHGAAMANTLFMREESAILEIASKHCATKGRLEGNRNTFDLDTVANVSDANAWVPWHTQSLGIYHMPVPCFYVHDGKYGFETENESLVQLALILLMLPRRLKR